MFRMFVKLAEAILFIVLFTALPVAAQGQQSETCFYFFYGQGCPHCSQVEPYLDNLEKNDSNLQLHRFEIYSDRANALTLTDYFTAYNIPNRQQGVPVIFIGDQYIVGGQPIIDNLDQLIKNNQGAQCPILTISNQITETNNSLEVASDTNSPTEKLKALSIATVIGAAVVDSINPCAIAVLLILLSALLLAGNKKRAIRAGLAFTASIYIAYFLFGLGLFSALQVSGLSYWFNRFVGLLAILIGLANLKDYFWYGGAGFVMEIPRRWRPTLQRLLKKTTSPLGAFLIGFVVTLFELPCTGGPYIVILGLLAERTTQLQAIPILLLYNLFFILPLIIITLMVYAGFTSVEKANEWKEKNIRKLHLIAGIIMLALGLIVLLGLI